jgi:hypothetical protein
MYEAVFRAELPASSELKAQIEAVCVTDSFAESSAPPQGMCSILAAPKSKSSKLFVLNRCRPVALNPRVKIFPVSASR